MDAHKITKGDLMVDRIRMTHPELGGAFYARPASVDLHKHSGWVESPDEPDEPRRLVDEEPPAPPAAAELAPPPVTEPAVVTEPTPVPTDGGPVASPEPAAVRVADKKRT